MAENVVSIQFVADDSSTNAAFSKLESQMKAASSAQSAPASSQDSWMAAQTARQATYRAELAKTQAAEEKTAAARRAAPDSPTSKLEEAARLREVAAAQGNVSAATDRTSSSLGKLINYYAAYRIARAIYDGVKYVVTSQADYEGEKVRFQSLAGSTQAATTAFEGLKKVSQDTNTDIVALGKAGTTLFQAGVPMGDIDKSLETMGKMAKVAGVEVGALASAYEHLSMGQVSGSDIAMISGATGDSGLLAEYKEMAVEIPLIAQAMHFRQQAAERTLQDEDQIATRLEKENHLLVTRARQDRDQATTRGEQDFDRAETRATHDADRAETRAESDRNRDERRKIEDWQGQMSMGQMARGPIGPRFPGGFTPDEGPLQQETYSKFGKGGAVIEGSYERKIREEKNREGFAAEDRAREDRDQKEQRDREDRNYGKSTAREDRNLASSRGRQDVNQAEERALTDAETKAGYGRQDKGRDLSRSQQDERDALTLRAEFLKKDLIERGEAGLKGASPDIDKKYSAYKDTTQGHLDAAGLEIKRFAEEFGDSLHGLSKWIDTLPGGGATRGSGEFPAAAPRVKKPGEPGYDYGNAGQPQASAGKTSNGDLIPHLAAVAENTAALLAIFRTA